MSRSSEAREHRLKMQQARAPPPPTIQTLYQMGHQPSAAAMAYMYGGMPAMYPGYQMAMTPEQYAAQMQYAAAAGAIPLDMQMQYAAVAAAAIPPVAVAAVEEDADAEQTPSNILPMHGNTSNFNINSLLYNNILENEYFKALYQLRTYHEVIDEMQRSIQHVEPWQMGTARFPSTAFCLMAKCMSMKLTVKQMKGLLDKQDNPLVRAVGYLYLRYTAPPADLWKWFEPYLEEETEIAPCADKNITMTIGEYLTKLLTEMQYYGTTLPRIPVPIERKIKVMLLLLNEKKKRRASNMRAESEGLFSVGAKVRAIYSDAENEPAWYDAVIESYDSEEHKYWVKFPEYGNTECVDLGDMELLSEGGTSSSSGGGGGGGGASGGAVKEEHSDVRGSKDDVRERGHSRSNSRPRDDHRGGRDRSRDRDHREHRDRDRRRGDSRSRSRDRDDRGRNASSHHQRGRSPEDRRGGSKHVSTDNLLEQVLQSERNASAAVGKNYGARPATYKGSLSLKADRYTARQKSPPRSERSSGGGGGGGGGGDHHRRRSRSRSPARSSAFSGSGGGGSGSSGARQEMSQEQIDRMKMLKDRYGDASAK